MTAFFHYSNYNATNYTALLRNAYFI